MGVKRLFYIVCIVVAVVAGRQCTADDGIVAGNRCGQPFEPLCPACRNLCRSAGTNAVSKQARIAHTHMPQLSIGRPWHDVAPLAATTTICAAFGHYHRCCGCPSLHLRAAAHFALESFLFCGTRTRPSQPANG